jgi:hypothetical protein
LSGRLTTFAGAVLALIVATGLLFSNVKPVTPPDSRPGSQDSGRNGLLAMYRWLERSGQPVRRLNTRYTSLAELPVPKTGNLLVAADPVVVPVRDSEAAPLARWVSAGNAVLVLGPIPQWAGLRQESTRSLLKALDLGLRYGDDTAGVCADYAPQRAPKTQVPDRPRNFVELSKKPPQTVTLSTAAADRGNPLLAGVDQVEVSVPAVALPQHDDYPVPVYRNAEGRIGFVWLCDVSHLQSGLAQFRLGDGVVWVTGYGGMFDNSNLGRASNARLLSNLVSLSVHGDGVVIFDDVHQGDSELYDPTHFFQDPRLHASIGLLLLIWLVYLLGYDNRFAPPRAPASGVTPATFVRSIGGFYARSVSSTEAAHALLTRFHHEVRRRLKRPGNEPAWSLLAEQPQVDAARLRSLQAEAARVDALRAGRTRNPYPRDLRRLLALIHDIQESIR